mgnify:CR=1 FL=1
MMKKIYPLLLKVLTDLFKINYSIKREVPLIPNIQELFTDFVEKNDLLNVYGPLNMRTRPKEFREVKNYALDSE